MPVNPDSHSGFVAELRNSNDPLLGPKYPRRLTNDRKHQKEDKGRRWERGKELEKSDAVSEGIVYSADSGTLGRPLTW